MRTIHLLCSIILVFATGNAWLVAGEALPDTVYLSMNEAERQLLSRNLLLAAQQLSIQEHKANAEQEGLWDNPTISFEQNIYNQETGKYFPTDEEGQFAITVEQPFTLSGKRNKRVHIETINAEIASHNLDDLLRTLRHEMRVSFYDLYFSQLLLAVYDREIKQMESTVQLFQTQYEKGNISQKELIRLKAFLLSLETDRKDLHEQVVEDVADLSLLMGDSTHSYFAPLVNIKTLDYIGVIVQPVEDIIDSALLHRPDLTAIEANTRLEEEDLSLQKAIAIPDVKLGFMYDRNASYIPDYKALTLEVDVPLFNRNQGSIEAAEYRAEGAKKQLEQYKRVVENDVRKAYDRAQETDRLYRMFNSGFASDFDGLIGGTIQNYEKGNITVLEFLDFFESYKNTMVEFYRLRSERMKSLEDLNYATGTIVIGE